MPNIDILYNNETVELTDIIIQSDGDLTPTDNLDSAIFISLFTDKRVSASEVPIPERRRGWWADLIQDDASYQLGSKLWLLHQSRCTREIQLKCHDYIKEALQWLIDENYLKSVSVTSTRTTTQIRPEIKLIRKDDKVINISFNLFENSEYKV